MTYLMPADLARDLILSGDYSSPIGPLADEINHRALIAVLERQGVEDPGAAAGAFWNLGGRLDRDMFRTMPGSSERWVLRRSG